MKGFGRRIVHGALWTAAETWLRHALTFIVFIVLARFLGAEGFGLAALAMMAPVILAVLVTVGIPEALVQRPSVEAIHFDSSFWLLLALGVLLTLLIWASANLIASAFGQPALAELVRWTSFVVFFQSIATVPGAVLRRQLNFRVFALRTAIATAIGGVVGITMAIANYGVWSLIAMQLVRAALEPVILFSLGEWRPRLRFSYARCAELFGFAGPLALQSLWAFVNDEIPKLVLGLSMGPAAVGIYTFARRPLDLLAQVVLQPVLAVVMPTVSRVQHDIPKIERFFDNSVRLSGLIGIPVFAGFAAIAPLAIPLVFGSQWSSAIPSAQILMLLGMLRTIDHLLELTILALGHSGLILKLSMAYTIVVLIFTFLAVQFTLETTMLAVVASNALFLPILLYLAHRKAHIDVLLPLRSFPRMLLLAMTLFVVVTTLNSYLLEWTSELAALVIGLLIGSAIYTLGAFFLLRREIELAYRLLLKS